MSILVDKNTRLLVQGITGREGTFHTNQMIAFGTNVVGGVVPGKGGQSFEGERGKLPIFDTVRAAAEATGANASIIFVPAKFAPEAMYEAADAGLPLVVCLTEHIPVLEMISVRAYLDQRQTRLIGPNCPGLITPGEAKVGIIPSSIVTPGTVGLVSRSGTLTYEVVFALTQRGIGQSTCVGIGGDPIKGMDFIDVLRLFEADPNTSEVIMIGEIGGNAEEQAARYIADHMTKRVTSFIAGLTAPPGRRMGHAGAIVEGKSGTAEGKIAALEAAGVQVAKNPDHIVEMIA
ncbi:MAG: succinate--CoA ligase subunit alpha [Anaerolineales bacterium]|uniref:succinate--CoA ligase subunit alpha n=1 Tax=Promineifilum sp. TaxID=2664178 RepID=UPI001DC6EAD6|nr:succinate--CoA ligase subunit alpha [Anaerolineales bacterium]MCB8934554.1 succinate--CoA ligase subunit alpha [Promineifilum sp.]MCO5179066.1 succinate--CoA ligase subunit alpha [Promineifilum sp.]